MPPISRDKGFNLNTIVLVITIVGMIVTGSFYIAPLKTLPASMNELGSDLRKMQITQAVQAQSLQVLTEVAASNNEARRDIALLTAKQAEIERRLQRVEGK